MNGMAAEVFWSTMLAARECASVEGLLRRKAIGEIVLVDIVGFEAWERTEAAHSHIMG